MPIVYWNPTIGKHSQMGHSDLKSVLDTTLRMDQERRLLGDTKILMRDQASSEGSPYTIKASLNPSWKLGKLYLTPSRLFFIQGRYMLFLVHIKNIVGVSVRRRSWIAGRMINQLCLHVKDFKPFYVAIRNPQNWQEAIENLMI